MAQHVFPNINALMQSVGSHLASPDVRPHTGAVDPEGVYTVDHCPVIFVAKNDGSNMRVALKRMDWKTLSVAQRFRASLLSIFGLAMGRKTYLSTAHTLTYRACLLRVQNETNAPAGAQQLVLSRLRPRAPNAVTVASTPVIDGASQPIHRTQGLRELHQHVVTEFGHRLRHILPSVLEQYIRQPTAVAEEACRKVIDPIRTNLNERLRSFSAVGMGEAERNAIVRELGFEQCIARWARVSAQHTDPASRSIAMSLTRVDYRLDEIPAWQRHIDPTADAVLGDMHGNCRLLLHSLVSLGFFAVEDPDAWHAVSRQLASLESDAPDNDWQAFRVRLSDAIKPANGVKDRRLTLLGGLLADRCGNDMFMAAILGHMAACHLNFDCMLGSQEVEFLSYFLKNRGTAGRYSFGETGVRMDEDQCRSLHRLDALLQQQPDASGEFERMIGTGFLEHLKVASFSRSGGNVFYSHAFANGALLSDLFIQTGVRHTVHIAEQIRELNKLFKNNVLASWQAFNEHFHARQQDGATAPVPPLRAIARNIGMDLEEYRARPDHANNAGIRLAAPFNYAVHGHCQDVATHVRVLVKRTEDAEQVLRQLQPLTDTRRRFLTGIRPYLPTLNRVLATVDDHTASEVLEMLAPFVERRLRELMEESATQTLLATLRDTRGDTVTRATALSDFWNMHCQAGKAALTLNFGALPHLVQCKMLESLLGRLAEDRSLAEWSAEASNFFEARQTETAVKRQAFTNAIRGSLNGPDVPAPADVPLSEKELSAYLNALKRRFFSIEDPAGSWATDNAFSRLAQIVPRIPYGVRDRANA